MSDFEIMLEMLTKTPNFDKDGNILWDVVCLDNINVIHVAADGVLQSSALTFSKKGHFLGINFELPEVA